MKYEFEVEETYDETKTGIIIVEAESEDEAEDLAQEKYKSGEVEWEDRRGYNDGQKNYTITRK